MLPKIALSGRSGSGKTTIAQHLCDRYGYSLCSSGAVCRELTRRLFDDDSKQITNRVTDSMKAIDPLVWIKAALRTSPGDRPCVFDSMRYLSDHAYFRANGFLLWQVRASIEQCTARLINRNQQFTLGQDEFHSSETELLQIEHDLTLDSENNSIENLLLKVDAAIADSLTRSSCEQ